MEEGRPARPSFRETFAFKVGVSLAIVAAVVALLANLDLQRDLSHLHVKLLSGSPEGHYHLVAQQMSDYVARQRGRLENVSSDGTVDNLQRLAAARSSCDVQFALAQDGADWPEKPELQLIGALPHAETVFLLGKAADGINNYAQLAHLNVGIGPPTSGTAKVARQIFESPDFQALGLALSHHPLQEQVDLAAQGRLDLAMFVMDEDAPLIRKAVREQGLQVAGFPAAQVMARQSAHVKTGTLFAGEFDPIRMLPPTDKGVLQIETLVVTNGCASRSQTIGLMSAISQVYPDFIRHNREAANTTGLRMNAAAKSYFEHEGPEIFDEYAPWLVDIMPPGNWVYIVTAISVLFNVMGFGNRYRLWQIDARRVKLEAELSRYFGEGATLPDIQRLEPTPELRKPERVAGVKDLVSRLEKLAARSRRDSLSVLVPMGQEMGYRYQESLIHQTLGALRGFLARVQG